MDIKFSKKRIIFMVIRIVTFGNLDVQSIVIKIGKIVWKHGLH